MDKQTLRNQIKALLIGMTDEERNLQSRDICKKIISLPEFCDAKTVYLYSPLKTEPDVTPVFYEAIRLGKKVAFPLCVFNELEFFCVESFGDLKPGAFGILEPDTSSCMHVTPEVCEKPIIVVPGLAFDREGHRLGRGRGFYDRYLAKNKFAYKVGCCFKNQIMDSIPYEKHDALVSVLWN